MKKVEMYTTWIRTQELRLNEARLKTPRFIYLCGVPISQSNLHGYSQCKLYQWFCQRISHVSATQNELKQITCYNEESNTRANGESLFHSVFLMNEPAKPQPVQARLRTVETTIFFMKTVEEQYASQNFFPDSTNNYTK